MANDSLSINFKKMKKKLLAIFDFYYSGFKEMTVGKKLWMIILIKLFILFIVLKIFFFPNILKSNYDNDEDRSNHVINKLTNIK